MISLGKSNFEKFGWFHPDDADKVEVEEGKDVYYFLCDDGSGYYKFVHQGGEIYSFDNYEVFKVDELKSVEKRYCNRCNNKVGLSELEDYSYQCFECDEDLYGFETYTLVE